MSIRKNKARYYAATKEYSVVPQWFKRYFE